MKEYELNKLKEGSIIGDINGTYEIHRIVKNDNDIVEYATLFEIEFDEDGEMTYVGISLVGDALIKNKNEILKCHVESY